MKEMLLLLFSVFLVNTTKAQVFFNGRIIDSVNNEAVEGAVIFCNNKTTTSAKDGSFSISVSATTTNISITAIGYQSLQLNTAGKSAVIYLRRTTFNLKELVIAAGNANKVYSTISKIDLNKRPVNSAQEFLRYVPGLFIAQHQGGGKAEQIFLRGFDVDHGTDVQITVDGIPVNMPSHAHGQGYADMHFVIPELVKTIDYGKGSYYTEHGNFNTAGYVELQTVNRLIQNTVQLEAGLFNSYRALAIINLLPASNKKQNAFLASEFIYSDGPFESAQHFNRFNIWGKYNAELNERNKIFIQASVFNSKWDASGQIPERAVANNSISRFGAIDNTEGGYTGRINFSAKLQQRLHSKDQLEHQLYYSRYHFNLFSNFTFFLNDAVNGDQILQQEARDIFGWQSNWQSKHTKGKTDFTSSIGSGLRFDITDNSELSHTKNKAEVLEAIALGNVHETNGWLYADEKIEMGKWLLTFGARVDYFHFKYSDKLNPSLKAQEQFIVSPKANLFYTLNKTLQLYFKNGKGFHSNDTRVVLPQTGREVLPASYGSDLGFIWKPFKNLLLNAAVWHLFLQQEFVYVGDEGIVEPAGKTRRYGADISVRWQLLKQLFADGNLNLAHTRSIENAKDENYIPLAPTVTSTGGINYQQNNLSAAIRYRYIAKRAANEDYSITAKGYFITDASVSYALYNWEISAVAENLFNSKWNEAQFATESRLRNEPASVTELHFTPGNPFFLKLKLAVHF
ncbi:TonB-dependent receptor [Lacibacter luteus]|uniref:TonB-dependent receptor n=1 Tax=Lacibacter luteus TaxID=2508719 RepID=A0A4Q1CHM1_9BACT|nr:TonB-dependent receptor [Lacibacter luteus]RXK59411.1 TonB-dependent receptor [Lacibacter luteus]